jgi:hypothetical protein
LTLASELVFRRGLSLGLITHAATVASYQRDLVRFGNNFLILSEPPPKPEFPVNELLVAAAAIHLGFRQVKALRAPDGRKVGVWWRDIEPS